MNYRHGFHAGNHADVMKHAVLLFCLDALKRKPAPFAVLDTHAGRGLYDLESEESQRNPEWRDGVAKLWDWSDPPPLIARYLQAVRSFNAEGVLRTYPGSPALVVSALRESDVLMACELHTDEFSALKRALPQQANVQLHRRDAWEALKALTPPAQRRGLVLIDPPYEAPDEIETAVEAIAGALRRFGHGSFLWWRPIKSETRLRAADAELRTHGAHEALRVDFWVAPPQPEGRLVGSSLYVINPPFGLQAALVAALPSLVERLDTGGGGWRVAVA
jgi:23S rRNA (adenine2030-N6)-methyltransferase